MWLECGQEKGEKGESGNVPSGPAQQGPKQVRLYLESRQEFLTLSGDMGKKKKRSGDRKSRVALKRNSDFVENVFEKSEGQKVGRPGQGAET